MKITIPDVNLPDLHLKRDSSADGNIEFDWSLIEDICDASGIDISEFRNEDEDNVCHLIHQWYSEHRTRGGRPDPVMEDILVEEKLEEIFGSPGHKSGNT